MNNKEFERRYRIKVIADTIKKAKEKGKLLDYHKFIKEIMINFAVSKRTAREYLEIADFNNDVWFKEMPHLREAVKKEEQDHALQLSLSS